MTSDPVSILRDFVDTGRTARDLALGGANLRRTDLSGLRADGLDLEEADLRESSLVAVNWTACVVRDARLDSADFTDAVLRMCDLDQARASAASFVRTSLENSSARAARFDGADLTGALLTDTDFSRASLRGAVLDGASASGADFRGADLRGSRLRNAVLVDADLRGADLGDADLTGADLTGADLTGADLSGADLQGAVIDRAALPGDDAGPVQSLPAELEALSATMSPIVLELLRTAGQHGFIDSATSNRLAEDLAALRRSTSPAGAPGAGTLQAVSRALQQLDDGFVPRLLDALRQQGRNDPPPEVMALIHRLGRELALDETASADDIVERLLRGLQRRPGRPS